MNESEKHAFACGEEKAYAVVMDYLKSEGFDRLETDLWDFVVDNHNNALWETLPSKLTNAPY